MEKKSYPRIPEKNWWSIRDQFKRTLPSAVNANYLKMILGLNSEKAAANLISPLRQLGLIDQDGKPTTRANAWRNDEKYAEVCSEMVEEVYPAELRDIFPDNEIDASVAAGWFMDVNSVGEKAAAGSAAMFALLKSGRIANINSSESRSRRVKRSIGVGKGKVLKTVSTTRSDVATGESEEKSEGQRGDRYEPTVHIDLQIHLSPEVTPEQIDQMFASMAKHLYRHE